MDTTDDSDPLGLAAWHLAIATNEIEITNFDWGDETENTGIGWVTSTGTTFPVYAHRVFPNQIEWTFNGHKFYAKRPREGVSELNVYAENLTWALHHVASRDVRSAREVVDKLRVASEWFFKQGFDKATKADGGRWDR